MNVDPSDPLIPPVEPEQAVSDRARVQLGYASLHPPTATWLGHPRGLFVLFLVEMWERFSYYGMRALLFLYLVTSVNDGNPGRGWSTERAGGLYGWYTGMAYLLPIVGGLIADKLIGTHRSMIVGSLVIALGHVVLAVSGIGALAHNEVGLSLFVLGLALVVIGTGHFKPNVSVMVDRLYPAGDARRDGAFTIFYMGINVGAFLGPLICSYLGEKVGWHWGFGAAAVGMVAGLVVYLFAKPCYLPHIGSAPEGRRNHAPLIMLASVATAIAVAALFHVGTLASLAAMFDRFVGLSPGFIIGALTLAILAAAVWFVQSQAPDDRGPVTAILLFVLFNAVFWLAYEQAGSSLNLFAFERTDRDIAGWVMPAGWFQSLGALLVIVLAPLFAVTWSVLARRNANPSQPVKLAMGLVFLGIGYVFMVLGSTGTSVAKASMFWLTATYFWHTAGELCMSPTGLSFLTRVAPIRSVSLLMGIWFLSNAVANKVGGQIAGQIDRLASGEIRLPWSHWFSPGELSDFFLFFVFLSVGAGIVVLILTPLLKRLTARRLAATERV